jgi:hypothetical protein
VTTGEVDGGDDDRKRAATAASGLKSIDTTSSESLRVSPLRLVTVVTGAGGGSVIFVPDVDAASLTACASASASDMPSKVSIVTFARMLDRICAGKVMTATRLCE